MGVYLLSCPMLLKAISCGNRPSQATDCTFEVTAVDPLKGNLLKVLADRLCLVEYCLSGKSECHSIATDLVHAMSTQRCILVPGPERLDL